MDFLPAYLKVEGLDHPSSQISTLSQESETVIAVEYFSGKSI
jgi:hypothetical protein